jgi:hypothetical protein
LVGLGRPPFERKGEDESEAASLYCPVSTAQTNAVQEYGTYGEQSKAVGCVSPTALLSLGWQFDLIEIKAARSGLMLFFLYLPLSLIFLKDEFDGWACATIYSF